MPTQFDEAFARVQKLVAIFESGKDHYLSGDYQEADVRKDFVDKFFTALGWDVNHDQQTNPYAQEVKVERGVNEGSSRKRADYAFHLAPNFRDVRFYVEAKRPSRDFGSADNYHQAIRYGWFTKRTSPFAVLTSFEDFHILDCRLKPNINDTLSRVVERFSYTDYVDPEKFARIYWLFSREAVAGGSLEKFAESRPVARGKKFQRGLFKGGDTQPDVDFLEELDGYRQQLAQAFKRANPDLDGETLTEVTQRTLDRLVFTRFLEDKGIESPVIENFGKQDGFWEDFIAASLRLDRKYNGVVFKQHPRLDAPGFKPDEKVFARICEELTDPTSPYNFNVIPIHILGSIYERFLGKVISDGARVVEKPEVRKAGGVYYTPEYIVRYIVENTVGKLIAGRTPGEISKLKFADIACGSGSFLLGVYDVLLKYHAEYYSQNPGKVRKGDCVRRDGTLHLSLQKKRDILTNNLFGVDIDRQAVEVAQLSLYLKLLEDETVGTTSEFQDEFHFTLLPSLDKNIVCGNSLIGPDIAVGGALTDEEEKKINPLDYAQRFPTIFRRKVSGGELHEASPGSFEHNVPGGMPLHGSYAKGKKSKAAPPRPPESEYEGGFDAIVGNPPYRMLQPHNTDEITLAFLRKHYVAAEFKIELFHLFIQRAVSLVKAGGFQSYIVPTTILNNVYAESLRRWILNKCQINQICVAQGRVFADADVHTSVLIFELEPDAKKRSQNLIQTTAMLGQEFASKPVFSEQTSQTTFANLQGCVWNILVNERNKSLITRLTQKFSSLNDVAVINRGLITGDRKKYFSKEKETKDHVPIIAGGDVQRYFTAQPGEFVLFKRPETAGGCWDKEVHFAPHKLVVRQICEEPTASIVRSPLAVTGNIFTVRGKSLEDELYLLGIINSRLSSFFWKTMFADFKDSFPQVTIFSLEQLPVKVLEFSNPSDKSRHDRLVDLVEQMLAAKAKLPSVKTEGERDRLENKCATLDQQIDTLVYELYGLTDAEIKLVEGTT
jgi:type I restriction-modification system DNA methylase subunit